MLNKSGSVPKLEAGGLLLTSVLCKFKKIGRISLIHQLDFESFGPPEFSKWFFAHHAWTMASFMLVNGQLLSHVFRAIIIHSVENPVWPRLKKVYLSMTYACQLPVNTTPTYT